jgi:MFS family permease
VEIFTYCIFNKFLIYACDDTKGLLCVVQSVNGFSQGILFPLLLGMSIESIPHEKRATAMGAYQALYAIGMFAGPLNVVRSIGNKI